MNSMLMIVALVVFGAVARRLMGGVLGSDAKGSRYARLVAVAFPTALPLYTHPGFWQLVFFLVALAAAAAVASTGDGDGTDLGEFTEAEPDPGSWDWVAGESYNGMPYKRRLLRDLAVLWVSGMAQTAMAGLLMMLQGFVLAGVVLWLSGALKMPAYWVAKHVPSNIRYLVQGRELGEALWGASLGLGGGAAIAISGGWQ